ncbi:hypothetical protein LTR17_001368 [Elasticomyces elasticus]|nr:hypothetical protein LTR17_001368 [Elasticomyces elasticus]
MEQHGHSSRKRGPDDETSGNEHQPKRRNNKGKGRAVDATDSHDSSSTVTCSTPLPPVAFDPNIRSYFTCHQCHLRRPHPYQQSSIMDDSCEYCQTNTLGADSLKEMMYCLAGRHATPRIFFMSRHGAQLSECCQNHELISDAEPIPSVNLPDGADLWDGNADAPDAQMDDIGSDASDDSWHTMTDQSPETVN